MPLLSAFESNAYALLIGVDDYSVFDASLGQRAGTSDLMGAVNDVRAWWVAARMLGIPPRNIRVLTSPPLGPKAFDEAHEATFGRASAAAISAGFDWLIEQARGPGEPSTLLFMGGHAVMEPSGVETTLGLATDFCPADATGRWVDDELVVDGGVSMLDLSRRAAHAKVTGNMTAVLDVCCAPALRKGSGMLWVRRMVARREAWAAAGERVVRACAWNARARESTFGGVWYGAFSWAMTRALEQWRVAAQDQQLRSTASYGRIAHAANAMLDGLGFEQRATLNGLAGVEELPFFCHGRSFDGATEEAPGRPHRPRQSGAGVDDFRLYQIDAGRDAKPHAVPSVGVVLTTATPSPDGRFLAGSQYWRLNLDGVQNAAEHGLQIWLADCSWGAVERNAALREIVEWRGSSAWIADQKPASITAANTPAGVLFRGKTPQGEQVGVSFSGNRVTWFNQAPDYLFNASSGALFNDEETGYDEHFGNKNVVRLECADNVEGLLAFESNVRAIGQHTE